MVLIDRIVTRGGDTGTTGLADGSRLAKDDPRIEALGAVDEANAAIGLVRVYAAGIEDAALTVIQNDLFDVGADLARPEGATTFLSITPHQVQRLEQEISTMNQELPPLNSFVLPGGAPGAAHAHLARTIVRRAERRVVTLATATTINPEIVRYLNRLSDYLFVIARRFSSEAGDVLWQPGAHIGT